MLDLRSDLETNVKFTVEMSKYGWLITETRYMKRRVTLSLKIIDNIVQLQPTEHRTQNKFSFDFL